MESSGPTWELMKSSNNDDKKVFHQIEFPGDCRVLFDGSVTFVTESRGNIHNYEI